MNITSYDKDRPIYGVPLRVGGLAIYRYAE